MSDVTIYDSANLSPAQFQALSLIEVALALDKARSAKDALAIAAILKRNQELWMSVRIMAERSHTLLSNVTKINLHRLSDFVLERCSQDPENMADRLIDTLININLQISEGILEREKKGLVSHSLPTVAAFSLTEVAVALDVARQAKDAKAFVVALDRDMAVWIAIKTMADNPQVMISATLRRNLTRLSGFVTETIMEHGVKLEDETIDTLININFQISEGLLEGSRVLATSEEPSLAMSSALSLVESALALDVAYQGKDKKILATALETNLQLWVSMKTLMEHPNLMLIQETQSNIIRLSDYVADTTFQAGIKIETAQIEGLININFQIAEGLLTSLNKNRDAV